MNTLAILCVIKSVTACYRLQRAVRCRSERAVSLSRYEQIANSPKWFSIENFPVDRHCVTGNDTNRFKTTPNHCCAFAFQHRLQGLRAITVETTRLLNLTRPHVQLPSNAMSFVNSQQQQQSSSSSSSAKPTPKAKGKSKATSNPYSLLGEE
jgi:hypothetical protein